MFNEVFFFFCVVGGLFNWEVVFFCLFGDLVYVRIFFSCSDCGWFDGVVGVGGVVWRVMISLGFYRIMLFLDIVWFEKYFYGRNCVFLKL